MASRFSASDQTRSGGVIPADGAPAYTAFVPADMPVPILIAVPHAGRAYPPWLKEAMRDPRAAPARLEDRFVDRIGEEVAALTGAALLVAQAPRALLDLNRAPDDIDWSMIADGGARRAPHSAANRRARGGLGLVPRRLQGTGELWKHKLTRADLEARIAGVHKPYHAEAAAILAQLRDRWGAALLIDLHSMPPLKHAGEAGEPIEFVLGDRFGASADGAFSAHALQFMARAERRMAHNRPYSGGFALQHQAAPRRGLHALQIEVCRSIYLDAHLDRPGPRLPAVARVLAGLVRSLAREVARFGDPASLAHAAE